MIYSFFNKENKIDTKLIIEQVNMVNSMGVHGIACLGLGTEVNKLSFKEKVNIIRIVSKFKFYVWIPEWLQAWITLMSYSLLLHSR